jgi:Na+-transporting NADH:ubiquinone oxidoreductase subunit B
MQALLWLGGAKGAIDPLRGMLAGSFMIGAFFYATDPVSAPKKNPARWMYGAFIGIMSSLITTFSGWPAGTMFSILLANMFAPITDHLVGELKARTASNAS